ncbi:biopolymer transporter ExbD [Verrucomicrobiaceae bacterium R5-34]|uniref:Biopolymer transporter ExbD n=1 Tax=Oceaniferula flava TaxID=2800421 RepID=A0AAE2SDK8_9BACT|nr:biopolymer transporter ExbD [Oceaniferula flavus]MBK1830495.1 biopolymer transporter ExbD [Verrucomicrobiaceae bacterium R5-34]MBK1854590.1 biopolymer transporter ExbD [Oceaniferula flavus]MBM1135896.1 biopolymer transporter ExbD [Oceaniferula flavus]
MRRFRNFNDDTSASEINISPLIDVVFILLIFFIVTTVFVEETGVDVNKPRAASAEDLNKNSILIAVTSNGQVYQGGRSIGVAGVRSVVAAMLESDDSTPVIIQGDTDANHGLVVQVIDAAKLAGAKTVNLATAK